MLHAAVTVMCICDASGNQEDPDPARNRPTDGAKCRACSSPATRGMETSTMSSSRSALVWTLVMLTAFCCEVRAAPQASSRLHSDSYNIPIPPAVLQELQYLGLSETVLQDLKQREEMTAVMELIQQYHEWQQQQQQQQQLEHTDDDINRQDSEAPPAPESYSNMPMPTFPTKFFRSQEGPSKDEKRTNHFTYACHFKICNIGRRHPYRQGPWIRR